MAHKTLLVALSLIVTAAPVMATEPDPDMTAGAPAAGPNAKYCMHIEAATGSRLETIRCWTRQEWAEQGVDVDHDWAKEGVSVIA